MLSIKNVGKGFATPDGTVGAVKDLSVEVGAGEYFVLLGYSGCGKTTLLRSIAGLEQPDAGEIVLGERVLSSAADDLFVEPEDRDIAMVFQSYAIWPHMSIWDNVAFPLQEQRPKCGKDEIDKRVEEILEIVNLGVVSRRSAASLSGGQQQRVALARALICKPQLLLMDEPLSNLDAKLRDRMRAEIRRITRDLGLTTVHVTHDQTEAMALADRIAVMWSGKIVEVGSPTQLYERPASAFVADFLGQMNWLDGTIGETGAVSTPIGPVRCETKDLAVGSVAKVGVRPEHVELTAESRGVPNEYAATILDAMFLGDATVYRVRVGEVVFEVKGPNPALEPGPAFAAIRARDCVVFDHVDHERLDGDTEESAAPEALQPAH